MEAKIVYRPRFDPVSVENGLGLLLTDGGLTDTRLLRGIKELSDRFSLYKRYYPYGLWAPGLSITREMRAVTDIYLPMAEITRIFDHLFSLSLKFQPLKEASILHSSLSWLDFLQALQYLLKQPDPSKQLARFAVDEMERRRFIFANFLPDRYGGGFGRYPEQAGFLAGWLKTKRTRFKGTISCLDTACGTGEGTYELAQMLTDIGFQLGSFQITGTSLEPLELFAAAHGHFPHAPGRESRYRDRIMGLVDSGAVESISFRLEDIGEMPSEGEEYHIIICNGILGGPFLSQRAEISRVVGNLSKRLAPGGILLADDRFHEGWKRMVSRESLQEILWECGLDLLPVPRGVGGVKLSG
jgi:SAM-dependent methyltransferase